MEATYHARITTDALAQTFDDAALEEIIAANLSQDLWLNLLRPEGQQRVQLAGYKLTRQVLVDQVRVRAWDGPQDQIGDEQRQAVEEHDVEL